jgi:mRNA capping enzyme, catalytic domain
MVLKFPGAQPVTFNEKTFKKSLDYYLTYKLDGLRNLLKIDEESCLINSKNEKTRIILPKKGAGLLVGTILDCELYKGKVYAFDILFYKGKDVTELIFSKRLQLLEDSVKILNSKKVITKNYISNGNSFKIFHDFENNRKKFPLETDGLIFTPNTGYYKEKSLKWKPSNEITIDFKVLKKDDRIILMTQTDVPFKYSKIKNYIKMTPKELSIIKDKSVYEFLLKDSCWKINRYRPDKLKSNHISVILSNLQTILNPPKMSRILKD